MASCPNSVMRGSQRLANAGHDGVVVAA